MLAALALTGCLGGWSSGEGASDGAPLTRIERTFSGYALTRVPVGGIPCEAQDPSISGDPSYFHVKVPVSTRRLEATLTWEETSQEMILALGPVGPDPLEGNSSTSGVIHEVRGSPQAGDWAVSAGFAVTGVAVHWKLVMTWDVARPVGEADTVSDVPCA